MPPSRGPWDEHRRKEAALRLTTVIVTLFAVALVVTSCGGGNSSDKNAAAGETLAPASTTAATPAGQASPIFVATATPAAATNKDRLLVLSPSQKICQLTGETDSQTGKPTASQ